jgi:hypothetical protein
MTKVFAVLAFAVILGGCGGGPKTAAPTPSIPTPSNPSAPSPNVSIIGDWTGTLVGTNFIGTVPFRFNVNSDLTWLVSIGGVYCSVGNTGASVVKVSGSQFSASGGSAGAQPSTVVLSGTITPDNQTISGQIAFSGATPTPCGTAVNPWTGTFVAQKQ